MDFSTIFLVFVLVLDLAISLWNAYASGFTLTLLRRVPGQRFAKASAVAGLCLAFAGMSYALLIVFSWIALRIGYLGVGDFLFLVSFDFLVFGAMIIGFGLVVTAQSVAVAVRERNWRAILVALYNVVTEIWDIGIYAEGFKDASQVVSSERNKVNLYAIVAAAVGVSFIVTYVAYRHGARKAEALLESEPEYTAAPVGPEGTPGGRAVPRSHELRLVVVAAVITIAVVLLLLWIAPYVTPKTQVRVTEIDVYAPTDTCGLGTNSVFYTGFNGSVGQSFRFGLEVLNFNATSCNVTSVTTNTSGFGLTNVGVPVLVPASLNATLNLTIVLPNTAYSGVLNLVYR